MDNNIKNMTMIVKFLITFILLLNVILFLLITTILLINWQWLYMLLYFIIFWIAIYWTYNYKSKLDDREQ